ncbi:hypothetical protein M422DRAFT_269434 [Sphaerobolus stellatus SS14]|uniref:MULE transposase domain-containing protein n=1 Tax=Sphaerobolus stellatus (strain SS14) TaxID=990650 RepID=A0A0C9TI25_SPHS4|nr:hypothetical protein M422DRAFT_269434 [Sphaerobolus stellatus SS14]
MASGSGDPLFSGVNITSIPPAPEKSVFQRGGEIKVHIRFLHTDQAQQDAIALAYEHGTPFFKLYTSDSSAQSRAQGILKDNWLDIGNLGDLGNRWSIRWSSQNIKGSEQRHEKNLNILRIAGIISHNEECCKQIMQQLPAIPLHEHVWQTAIEQLEQGASEWNPATANVRYELLPSDSCSLYQQFSRRLGVDITREAQYNIDDWLNKDSPKYKPEIAAAVFYYQGRIAQEKSLQVCIQTDEMKQATWKYTHQKQLILDWTFGICDRRILLFIALGVDENNKGVPLIFFLFSAPTGNRATHAGYDMDILHELLVHWRDSLGKKDDVGFAPCVAITESDTKERGAPHIDLAIYMAHFMQVPYFPKLQIQSRLYALEEQLIISINYTSATQIVDEERSALTWLKSLPDMDIAVTAGLAHIKYLTETWMPVSL